MKMNIDEYGGVINGEDTYLAIASELLKKKPVLVSWNDGEYDHRDILFCLSATKMGVGIQRGIKPTDLFVSIIGHNSYGFKWEETKYNSYIKEKLFLRDSTCDDKICDLINGVIECLKEGK